MRIGSYLSSVEDQRWVVGLILRAYLWRIVNATPDFPFLEGSRAATITSQIWGYLGSDWSDPRIL